MNIEYPDCWLGNFFLEGIKSFFFQDFSTFFYTKSRAKFYISCLLKHQERLQKNYSTCNSINLTKKLFEPCRFYFKASFILHNLVISNWSITTKKFNFQHTPDPTKLFAKSFVFQFSILYKELNSWLTISKLFLPASHIACSFFRQ